MRIALDTNILAYAEGVGDQSHRELSLILIDRLPEESVIVPVQVLGELYRVLTGKAMRNRNDAREAVLSWSDCFSVADSSWCAFQSAMDLSKDRHLQIWDALIMSVAADNHCRLLLSEDMQAGFTWRGVTVVDPYSPKPHPLLKAALK
jgi:predicted nucleic acid-binding protein